MMSRSYDITTHPQLPHELARAQTMLILTYLPAFITTLFQGMPGIWKGQHRLILCWLIVMQAIYPGRKTLHELARWSPRQITEWRFRRLLKASYWSVHLLIEWLAHDVMAQLPPPEDGIIYVIGDGSHKPKRSRDISIAQKGRNSKHKDWFFGIRFALLIVAWDVYRIPVSFRIILPKTHPQYRKENALFRDMLGQFKPPCWAQQVIVEGDAAYGAKANIKLVQKLDKADASRDWNFVFAIPRTWKTAEDKSVKDLVTHLPRHYYKRTWIPRLSERLYRKTYWVYAKRLCLRDIGEVTWVLSKTGRNVSPGNTKLLVSNLPDVTARQVVWLYQFRWSIELINRNLKSDLGLGQHQVRGDLERHEKSFGIAVLAYLFVLRLRHHEIVPGKPWSLSELQHRLRLEVITNQVKHNVTIQLGQEQKAA
jgi:DDE family transposase